MRTTVTLDPDTEQIVRRRMAMKGVSFKRALNDAIREGSPETTPYRYETPVFDMGTPLIDVTKALQLSGELEDAELLRKMREA